ncbi:MAG: hypothetical protein KW788_01275 [Candidatus Doudnabacteria bacterium]|nr:hypothetical protein [Candidatus Doudnabacteria bacterium]
MLHSQVIIKEGIVEFSKIQRAAKIITTDGEEGFRRAATLVGEDIALGMLVVHLRHSLNPVKHWPEPVNLEMAIHTILTGKGIFTG